MDTDVNDDVKEEGAEGATPEETPVMSEEAMPEETTDEATA
ncbi:MAG: hypothetical protein QG583_571 [Patescibacteria group bacterium]|jgi:hypothetical protein|nr:hypothetical protein [Patescibacteria group bacterium]